MNVEAAVTPFNFPRKRANSFDVKDEDIAIEAESSVSTATFGTKRRHTPYPLYLRSKMYIMTQCNHTANQ